MAAPLKRRSVSPFSSCIHSAFSLSFVFIITLSGLAYTGSDLLSSPPPIMSRQKKCLNLNYVVPFSSRSFSGKGLCTRTGQRHKRKNVSPRINQIKRNVVHKSRRPYEPGTHKRGTTVTAENLVRPSRYTHCETKKVQRE